MRKKEPHRKVRNISKRAHAPKWLICCEGKSEVVYLTALIKDLENKSRAQGKIAPEIHIGIEGRCNPKSFCGACGRQHKDLYKKVASCSKNSNYARVWILFDLDADCDPSNKQRHIRAFKDTINACETDSIAEPIWSIPCFEYWLALHSGNRIDVGSLDSFTDKIKKLGNLAIQKGIPCDKMYQSVSREHHCKKTNPTICVRALDKPYYNSYRALGGEEGCKTAQCLCESVYGENNPTGMCESNLDFNSITCCSNMHHLINALYEYFEDLPPAP